MASISPSVGSLSLGGIAPTVRVNTRLAPGYGSLSMSGIQPSVNLNQLTLQTNLPYFLPSFQDRRRIIRQTVAPIRDVVFNTTETEIYVSLQLNGDVYDAIAVTEIDLNYESSDGLTTGTLTIAANPTVFDLSRRMVIRGKSVNVIVIKITPALLAEFFDVGLWTMELFTYDVDNTAGVLWGTLEMEIRSVYEPVIVTVPTGGMSFTTYAPTVLYRFVQPDTASLQFTAYEPDVSRQNTLRPSPDALTFSGAAPSIVGRLAPAKGSLSFSGAAPVLT